MEDRRAKIRRLYASSGIAHAKLVQLMRALRNEDDLEEATNITTYNLRDAVNSLWKEVGELEVLPYETKKGEETTFSWYTVSFKKMLRHAANVSPNFREILREVWMQTPSTPASPLHLICYCDEVVPGNVLRLDNRRKLLAIYVTIREFGPHLIKNELMWLPIGLIRSSITKDVIGGVSNCMRVLLRRWFLEDKLHSEGVCLDLGIPDSGFATLYFKLGNLVADGDALRATWSVKGASGKLPCICCKNVLNERVDSDYLVHISCCDPAKFDVSTNEEVWAKADILTAADGTVRKGEFELQSKAMGLTYCPRGLLWDMEMRKHAGPMDVITYDAMHCTLSNGIAQNETSLLLGKLRENGIRFDHLREMSEAEWKMCKALGLPSGLRACFAPAREKAWRDSGSFKTGASEMLMCLPIILYFLESVLLPQGKLVAQVKSYRALFEVVNLIKQGKEVTYSSDTLARAIKKHAMAFTAAYPDADFKPKNHYLHHVASQFAREGVILDAFVGERKHQSIKAMAADVQNTLTYEKTVMMRVVAKQMAQMEKHTTFRDTLLSAQSCHELAELHQASDASLATGFKWHGTRVHQGDVVFINGVMYVVEAGASIDSDLYMVGRPCTKVGQVTLSASKWEVSDELLLLPLSDITLKLGAAWFHDGDSHIVCMA